MCSVSIKLLLYSKWAFWFNPNTSNSAFLINPRIAEPGYWQNWWGCFFLRWRSPSTMWAGPLIFFKYHRHWCLNNRISSNLGKCVVCWAHLMCHHELWSTSVSHPFSFSKAWKDYQKITIPILDVLLKTLLFHVASLIFSVILLFLLTLFWLVWYCRLGFYFSPGNQLSIRGVVNWCRVTTSNDKSTQWVPSFFLVVFYSFLSEFDCNK